VDRGLKIPFPSLRWIRLSPSVAAEERTDQY
jgi:hypothetical protein